VGRFYIRIYYNCSTVELYELHNLIVCTNFVTVFPVWCCYRIFSPECNTKNNLLVVEFGKRLLFAVVKLWFGSCDWSHVTADSSSAWPETLATDVTTLEPVSICFLVLWTESNNLRMGELGSSHWLHKQEPPDILGRKFCNNVYLWVNRGKQALFLNCYNDVHMQSNKVVSQMYKFAKYLLKFAIPYFCRPEKYN